MQGKIPNILQDCEVKVSENNLAPLLQMLLQISLNLSKFTTNSEVQNILKK
jgi:hypothetical protein